MNLKLPQGVLRLLEILKQNGYEAYVVGGCVRDCLLGNTPSDWDITTNARPEEVIGCFGAFRVIKTGLKHGTVTVLLDEIAYEVTTFRVDGSYSDHRRPNLVSYTKDLSCDLSRRDFTINAMAYHPVIGIVDLFDGQADLAMRRIKCVGHPHKRFDEDALRILRAIRIASQLDFEIEAQTAAAMTEKKHLLTHVSAERIRVELDKALLGQGMQRIFDAHAAIIFKIIPELKPCAGFDQHSVYHHLDVWGHILTAVELSSSNDIIVRLALFFHDIAKPECYSEDENGAGHFYGHGARSADIAASILTRLRYDNATRLAVERIIRYHDTSIPLTIRTIKRWLNRFDIEDFYRLLEVKRGDIRAHAPSCVETGLKHITALEDIAGKILAEKQCFQIQNLAVDGNDIISVGIAQGRQIGQILEELLDLVMEGQLSNDRQALLSYVRKRQSNI